MASKKYPKIDSGILQWIDKNQLVNSSNERFEWDYHNFLLLPMSDWNPEISIRKAAQVGFSESFGVLKTAYAALTYNWNIIYTLPTDTFAEEFSKTRFGSILENNPELASIAGGGAQIRKLGTAYIYFRGTYNSKTQDAKAESDKAISIPADLLVHDERDRSDQNTLEQYRSRIANSKYGGVWNFSNPTFPGAGTDGLYQESDQKVWMIKCPKCGHQQWLDWFKLGEVSGPTDHTKVNPKTKQFVCGRCEKPIEDDTRFHGEWVAQYPSRDASGYWMSTMNYVHHNAEKLLKEEKRVSKQNFYNFMLGKPYRGTDIVVDRSIIVKNIRPDQVNDGKKFALGVDNGIVKHWVLGNEKGIFKYGKTKSWDEIEQLLKDYRPVTVIDSNPFPNEPKKLAEKYDNVYLSFYKKDKDMKDAVEWGKKKIVYIQRTKYFDILVDKFNLEEKPINMIQRDLEEYIKHWSVLSRIDKEDAMGIIRGEWVSATKTDHFAHATVYQDVAMTRAGGESSVGHEKIDLNAPKAPKVTDDRTSALPDLEELIRRASRPTSIW